MFAHRIASTPASPTNERIPARATAAPQRRSGDLAIEQLQHSWASNQAKLRVPAKLAVGGVNDPLEHEADRVADQVMRMPERDLSVASAPAQLSRKCAACEEEEEKLQKKPAGPQSAVSEAPPIVHEVLRSSGQPLDTATRAYFEPRFGHDFSQVRVHTDARAAESAREVHALAYTFGSNVVFGANEYAPTTYHGRELLAHELAHTIQQRNASAPPPSADSSGIFEASAYAAARSIANGEVVSPDLPDCGIGLAPQVAPPSALSDQDLAEELKQATELKPGEQPGWWLNALRREAESRASLRARVERERTERIAAAKRAAAAERQRKERAAAVAEAEAGIARLEKQFKEGDKDDDIPAPRIPSRPTTLSLLPPDPRFKAQQQFAAEWIDRVEKQTDAELKRIDEQIQHDKDIANVSKQGSYQRRLRKVRSELQKLSPYWYSWDEAVSRMTGDEVWLWGVNNGLFIESEKRAVYEDQNSMQQLIREEQEEANRRRRAQFESEQYQRWVAQGEQLSSPALFIQPFAFAALSPFAGAAYAGTQIGEMLGEAYNACAHGSTEECLSATAKAGIAITLERATRGEAKPSVQNEPTNVLTQLPPGATGPKVGDIISTPLGPQRVKAIVGGGEVLEPVTSMPSAKRALPSPPPTTSALVKRPTPTKDIVKAPIVPRLLDEPAPIPAPERTGLDPSQPLDPSSFAPAPPPKDFREALEQIDISKMDPELVARLRQDYRQDYSKKPGQPLKTENDYVRFRGGQITGQWQDPALEKGEFQLHPALGRAHEIDSSRILGSPRNPGAQNGGRFRTPWGNVDPDFAPSVDKTGGQTFTRAPSGVSTANNDAAWDAALRTGWKPLLVADSKHFQSGIHGLTAQIRGFIWLARYSQSKTLVIVGREGDRLTRDIVTFANQQGVTVSIRPLGP